VDGYLAEITEKGGSEVHAPRAVHENGSGYRTSLERNTAIVKLQFVVNVILFPAKNILYLYISTLAFSEICAQYHYGCIL